MLISLSRWVFLLLVADPIFPLACKSLISVKTWSRVLAQVVPGFTGQEYPTLAGITASRPHLSSQGHTSRFCHCHLAGLPHGQDNLRQCRWSGHFPGLQVALVTPDHARGSAAVLVGQEAVICAPQPAQCTELLLQFPTTSGSLQGTPLCI